MIDIEDLEEDNQVNGATTTPTPKPISGPIMSTLIDLSSPEFINTVPDTTRKVLLQSTSASHLLTSINPFKLSKIIDTSCGAVEDIKYLKNGGLYIECKSFNQFKNVLLITELKINDQEAIPVKATVALQSQSVYGKIFAPQIKDVPREELLDSLLPSGVVAIRYFFGDKTKSHIPLYVLTFFGTKCPSHIKVGYCRIKVDPHIPGPVRCGKCWGWGHTTHVCRSRQKFKNCGANNHIFNNCSASNLKCPNCDGPHDATSKDCPSYIQEKKICTLKSKLNISFQEARAKVLANPKPQNKLNTLHYDNNNNRLPPPNSSISFRIPSIAS
jgi:hypothetical protein